jgi:hypothetical protein
LRESKIINLDSLIAQLLDEDQRKLIKEKNIILITKNINKKILFSNKIIKNIKICIFCNKKGYSIDKYWKKDLNKFTSYNNRFNKIEKTNIINLPDKIEKNLNKKEEFGFIIDTSIKNSFYSIYSLSYSYNKNDNNILYNNYLEINADEPNLTFENINNKFNKNNPDYCFIANESFNINNK